MSMRMVDQGSVQNLKRSHLRMNGVFIPAVSACNRNHHPPFERRCGTNKIQNFNNIINDIGLDELDLSL